MFRVFVLYDVRNVAILSQNSPTSPCTSVVVVATNFEVIPSPFFTFISAKGLLFDDSPPLCLKNDNDNLFLCNAAKYHIATIENVSSGSHEISSNNTFDVGSSSSRLESAGQEEILPSLEVDNGASNCFVRVNGSTEKGESSKHGANDIEAFKTETRSIKDKEEPLKLSRNNLKASDTMVESAGAVSQCVATKNMVDRGLHDLQSESLRSTMVNSNVYEDSPSPSSADGRNSVDPNKKVVYTIDTKGKSTNNEVTAYMGSQLQSRTSPTKSSNERYISTPTITSESGRSELSSRYGFDELERESSFDSEDYHSVQNWMEPRKFAQMKSLSRDSVIRRNSLRRQAKSRFLRPDHKKILKKVDELRDELSDLFDQASEAKPKSHLRSIREEELTSTSVSPKPHNPKTYEHVLKDQDRKERKQPVRHHCRPVSGGAPFVICYKCLKLLQLPADFLVSSRTFHKLKCGSCSEILLYSFRARAFKAPQTPVVAQHLATEVDSSVDAQSSGCTREESIYSSEGYPLSFARSDLAVPEPVLHVSRSSSYQIEEQIDKQLKEAPQLHRLMGYASASEILYRFSDSDRDQSTRPTTPQMYRPFEEFDTRDDIEETELRTRRDDLEGEYSNSMEIREEDESHRRQRTRIRAPTLRVWLKKGMRELNHGLSAKLKIQSRIRTS